jgi:hypothetical protein
LLVAQLVETGQVTLDDLKELEATIETLAAQREPEKPTPRTAEGKPRSRRAR